MKDPVKALLYTAGTLAAAALTLVVGDRLCQRKSTREPTDAPPKK